jgi:hypothetical protein
VYAHHVLRCLDANAPQRLVQNDRLPVLILNRVSVAIAEILQLLRLHRLIQNLKRFGLRRAKVIRYSLRFRSRLRLHRGEESRRLFRDDPLYLVDRQPDEFGCFLAPLFKRRAGFGLLCLIQFEHLRAVNRGDCGWTFSQNGLQRAGQRWRSDRQHTERQYRLWSADS